MTNSSSLFKKKSENDTTNSQVSSLKSGKQQRQQETHKFKKGEIPKDNPLLSQAPSNSIIHQMMDTSRKESDAMNLKNPKKSLTLLNNNDEMVNRDSENFGLNCRLR